MTCDHRVNGPRTFAIAQPIATERTPFQCSDSVKELLESVVHREHRVDALAKLIELSEGIVTATAASSSSGDENAMVNNENGHGSGGDGEGESEGDPRVKLRVGLAFAAAEGFGILLPLLCHSDEQLRVGALELLASVCDLPSNRKRVVGTHAICCCL